MNAVCEIYGVEYAAKVGSLIKPENWAFGSRLIASDWSAAEFRLPSARYPEMQLAVNVRVTGRTLQRREGALWVRVEITFVGDGEPDTVTGGWMLAE